MAYDTFTLTGQHETPTGTAHSGSVVITPNATIRDTTGDAAIVGTPTITSVGADAGAAAWAVTSITAGVSSFNINVTGEAAKSIRWVARCDVAQVQG